MARRMASVASVASVLRAARPKLHALVGGCARIPCKTLCSPALNRHGARQAPRQAPRETPGHTLRSHQDDAECGQGSQRSDKMKEDWRKRLNTMQLTFLGTSSGTTTLTRNQQSLALEMGSSLWLFDCGEGVSKRLKELRLSPLGIKKIFISHMHGDHVYGTLLLPTAHCQAIR
eukprot:99022-Pleurochrysis_carterae.AAC.1